MEAKIKYGTVKFDVDSEHFNFNVNFDMWKNDIIKSLEIPDNEAVIVKPQVMSNNLHMPTIEGVHSDYKGFLDDEGFYIGTHEMFKTFLISLIDTINETSLRNNINSESIIIFETQNHNFICFRYIPGIILK